MSRNPYHSSDSTPALTMSVFVFMDILGYKDIIRESSLRDTHQEVLSSLYSTLTKGRTWLEGHDLPEEVRLMGDKDDYVLKAFTDNIVIGWPVSDDAESESLLKKPKHVTNAEA